jgi:Spy/CpxP family protein refolding chaperone
MKTKLLLAISCLLFFVVTVHAQQDDSPQSDFEIIRQMLAQMQSPMVQQAVKVSTKSMFRSFWDGQGTNTMVFGLLQDPEFRTALNVSDEQYQQIQNGFISTINTPENQELRRLEQEAIGRDYDEEIMSRLLELMERSTASMMSTMSDAIDNALTPEQKQKMQEIQLAAMGEMPIISPGIFEILNLTNAQKQQMEDVKKELEPEFEKHLETFVDGMTAISRKEFAEFERLGEYSDGEDIQKRMQTVRKNLMEDSEFKKIFDEIHSSGKAFAAQFQVKMFDVLTDEQWTRLLDLIDNPPEHARMFIKKMRERRGVSESRRGGGWQPAPDSWQPGDPIPEAYRIQRNTRGNFPRVEN